MAAPGTQIAGFLLDQTLTTVQAYVNTASAKMIQIIAPVAATLLIIYVLLWGAAMAAGQISEPFTDEHSEEGLGSTPRVVARLMYASVEEF